MKPVVRLVVALCAVLLGALAVVAPAQAEPKLPENYNFFGGHPVRAAASRRFAARLQRLLV